MCYFMSITVGLSNLRLCSNESEIGMVCFKRKAVSAAVATAMLITDYNSLEKNKIFAHIPIAVRVFG